MVVAMALMGCGKAKPPAATVQLEKSFASADDSIKNEVAQANTALQAKDYLRAVAIMDRVVATRPPDPAQMKAVDAVIFEARQAVEQNSKLGTTELYKAMSGLVLRVHGEP